MPGNRWVCARVLFKPLTPFLAAACGVALSAGGQSFGDMDFESIGASQIAPDGIWLGWSLAAPGWQHAQGGDSVFVYHNTPPQNSFAQYYFLADSASTQWEPLAGRFSLALVSGHFNRSDPGSPWVNAFIEQEGIIPAGTRSFTMLATGDFSVSINSQPVTMTSLGGNLYAGNVSEFAGELASLRIMNDSSDTQEPVLVDNLSFSPQLVPEPSTMALLGLGAVGLLLRNRRR